MNDFIDSSRLGIAILVVLLAALVTSSVGRAEESKRISTVEMPLDVTDFGEGWKASLSYPETEVTSGTTCRLWVEDGWLHAARVSDVGVEWRLTFVQVIEGVVPRVSQYANRPAIEVSYADEGHFIRDNSVVLRALRHRPDRARPTFKLANVSTAKFRPSGFCGRPETGLVVTGMHDGTWHCAMSGPTREKFDCFIRLNIRELWEPRQGFSGMTDGLLQVFHGDRWVFDDGEMLIAHYMNPTLGSRILNQKKIRENMPGSIPPEIEAANWFNVDEPLSRDELRGKVVLADFWATWCAPCIEELPSVQRLHDKYAEKGLVVIGIHSAKDTSRCKKFVTDHKISFPIVLDSGKTAEGYGVTSFPTYFLIDRKGKVVSGYSAQPPTDSVIESLLKQ
jgi:thiol-disulfide isomerase/thioredoxin